MIDLTSLIEIIAAIAVVYFFLKFIVSPVLKIIFGVIVFIILIYILQKFLGFDTDKVLATFGISFNFDRWAVSLNWILAPINYYIGQAKVFLNYIWVNFPKAKN